MTYTGHTFDAATGFTYMNARYYEPEAARFLTPDIFMGNPYNPNTQNVYMYVCGNPKKIPLKIIFETIVPMFT